MMAAITPTTHTPSPQHREPNKTPRRDEFRRTQVLIDRLRSELDKAEALIAHELPHGHAGQLSNAIDDAVRGLAPAVERVERWTRTRRYPLRRCRDVVEISGVRN